ARRRALPKTRPSPSFSASCEALGYVSSPLRGCILELFVPPDRQNVSSHAHNKAHFYRDRSGPAEAGPFPKPFAMPGLGGWRRVSSRARLRRPCNARGMLPAMTLAERPSIVVCRGDSTVVSRLGFLGDDEVRLVIRA